MGLEDDGIWNMMDVDVVTEREGTEINPVRSFVPRLCCVIAVQCFALKCYTGRSHAVCVVVWCTLASFVTVLPYSLCLSVSLCWSTCNMWRAAITRFARKFREKT